VLPSEGTKVLLQAGYYWIGSPMLMRPSSPVGHYENIVLGWKQPHRFGSSQISLERMAEGPLWSFSALGPRNPPPSAFRPTAVTEDASFDLHSNKGAGAEPPAVWGVSGRKQFMHGDHRRVS
jgi:hypothetical protein